LRDQKGQALIELSVSLLLLLLILFGITEFGRYLFYANTANNAARDGVRWAVTHAAASGWCADVRNHIITNYATQFVPALTIGNITVLVDEVACTSQPSNGSRVHVIVNKPFTILTGSIIPYFNNSTPHFIKGDASMQYEL
jgi:Flp pilus assembly protein TadG